MKKIIFQVCLKEEIPYLWLISTSTLSLRISCTALSLNSWNSGRSATPSISITLQGKQNEWSAENRSAEAPWLKWKCFSFGDSRNTEILPNATESQHPAFTWGFKPGLSTRACAWGAHSSGNICVNTAFLAVFSAERFPTAQIAAFCAIDIIRSLVFLLELDALL